MWIRGGQITLGLDHPHNWFFLGLQISIILYDCNENAIYHNLIKQVIFSCEHFRMRTDDDVVTVGAFEFTVDLALLMDLMPP